MNMNAPRQRNRPLLSRRRFVGELLLLGGAGVLQTHGVVETRSIGSGIGYSVRDFGAVGNGSTLETKALQGAIEACARAGGGLVYVPPGKYLTGTLFLKSHVTLHLSAGATLLGSSNLEDYPVTVPSIRSYTDTYTERSLIYGANLENVTLEGRGVIDGQGGHFQGPYKVRPYLIRLIASRDVTVRDLKLKDSAMWVQHYLACDGLSVEGLRVESRCNANNDGLDIDGCQRVRIAHCDIRSGDDGIVLKSTLDRPCRDVVISNCVLSSDCNAFKLGTESNGGFEDIVLSNCSIYDTRLAGLALEMVDGGSLERVTISDITMRNVRGAIFIRLGNRARPFKMGPARPGIGRLRQVRISNVQAAGADSIGCSITGLPEQAVEDIGLDNVSISFSGGGLARDVELKLPERPEQYPEYAMFGRLPAYGFYCRHARGLRLKDVRVELRAPDARPSLVCSDVRDLELSAWRASLSGESAAVVLNDSRDVFIHGCQAAPNTRTYLRVEGQQTQNIRLVANQLSEAKQVVDLDPAVPSGAVHMAETGPP
jgi:polygalacturonase